MNPRNALVLPILVAGLLCVIVRAEESKPDNDGFVRDWLMLAPSALPDDQTASEAIDKQQIPSEGKLQPKEGEKTKLGDKELTWKAVKAKEFDVDFNDILASDNANCVGYIVTYIVCDQEHAGLTLLMGSNDEGKVYLNGKEVVKSDQPRTLDQDSDSAENITLNKGVNTIVFKVINESNNWQACLRFKDKGGKVFKDFTVRTNP